jgi:hypothetical protein
VYRVELGHIVFTADAILKQCNRPSSRTYHFKLSNCLSAEAREGVKCHGVLMDKVELEFSAVYACQGDHRCGASQRKYA